MALKSEMPLDNHRSSITSFAGAFSTRPAEESADSTWGRTCFLIAPPDGPTLPPSKEQGVFFLPCLLREAPYIGKTLERAKERGHPLEGRQRSRQHVIAANFLVVDLDGITDGQVAEIVEGLISAGLSFLMFSTYSHGRVDKPGNRVRVAIPVDAALPGPEYSLAAAGLNAALLGGLADRSGFQLHQQQGIWATAPERKHLAFRRVNTDGVASAKALIEAAPVAAVHVLNVRALGAPTPALPIDRARVSSALDWLDANDYKTWVDAAIWLKASYGEAGFPAWLEWGETAAKTAKAGNDDRYAPDRVWASPTPYIPPQNGAGALFKAAMDAAMREIKAASQAGHWGERARAAALYVCLYHPRLYATFGVAS